MPVTMVYDLETIPDIETGRRILDLPETLEDKAVLEALFARQLEKTQGASSFLPHYLHRVVAISVVVSTETWTRVWSLGDIFSEESDIIKRFFEGIQRYTPNLISWNGSGFDLPVLHYRSLKYGISAPTYWELGENANEFKWNNYLSRYHQRHTDLMEVLASYQMRAYAPLNEIALLLGFPGKMGMQGDKVLEKVQSNELECVRNYCETDVLNTYLIYLRFQLIRGNLNKQTHQFEEERLKTHLLNSGKPHLLEFCRAWQKT